MTLVAVTLDLSTFISDSNHPSALPHKDTWWQVAEYGVDFDDGPLLIDTGWDAVNKVSYTTPTVLVQGRVYAARAAMRDSLELESEWSVPVVINTVPQAPRPKQLYFGRQSSNGVLMAEAGVFDDGVAYELLAKTLPLAPAGEDSECWFSNLYFVTENLDAVTLRIRPFVNGFEKEAILLALPAALVPTRRDWKIGLAEEDPLDTVMVGLRGTWLEVLVEIEEALDHVPAIESLEVEFESAEGSFPKTLYDLLAEIEATVSPGRFMFFGRADDGAVLLWEAALADDSVQPEFLIEWNEIAPDGAAGEAIFNALWLSVLRSNSVDFFLDVDVALEGGALLATTVIQFPAVAEPKQEIVMVPLYRSNGQVTFAPRGAWVSVRLSSPELPSGMFILEPPTLDWEEVVESRETVNA